MSWAGRWGARWGRRLRLLLHREDAERALDDEMRHHIECETAERIRQGMTPEEARRSALVDFGGVERFKEQVRDARGTRPAEDIARDLRYALRVLRRNPGFTAATVLTFALGIGASTAIFSVVYGVLLRPLPYADPERLVVLWEHDVERGRDRNVVALGNFEAWRERGRSFEGMAALVPVPVTLAGVSGSKRGSKRGPERGPERISGAEVSPGYFRLLGVQPALGRDLDDPDASEVVLSDAFWKSRFNGDPGVLGKTLFISGKPRAIVGVMPAGFDPPRFGWLGEQELWLPFAHTEEKRAWGRSLLVVARLKPGVELERAHAEMVSIASRLEREVEGNEGWSANVVGLAEQITGDVRAAFLVILGAVGLLLLMTVTNVATLLLALLRRRRHELEVRRAIGATDRRLFRQLFTQSALLGAIGSAAGILAAVPGVRLLTLLLPPEVPRSSSIRVDAAVLLVMIGAALITTILVGSVGAVRGKSGGGAPPMVSAATSARQGNRALVTAEIALALVLTVLAGLMVRSFADLRAVDLGFRPEGVATARVAVPVDRYGTPESRRAFFDALVERVRAIPGVRSAGLVNARPLGGFGPATSVRDPRRPLLPDGEKIVADVRFADPAYFRTLEIPIVAGSLFVESEPPRAVIDEALARTLWPSENPVGRRIHVNLHDGIEAEVMGVAGDVHLVDPRTPPRGTVYLSASRFPGEVRDLMVRTGGDPLSVVPALRSAVAALDPGLPLYQVATLEQLVDESLARDRFTTSLLGGFALISLLLAGVGVYGVFAGDVTRRRKEIGIRLALGSRRSGVILLILREALARALLGVGIGAAAALVLSRSMTSLLFGIGAADPLSYLAVAVLLIGLAAVATLIPAIQAARVSPLTAVRNG